VWPIRTRKCVEELEFGLNLGGKITWEERKSRFGGDG
jgi:hypothetical protein